MSRVAAAQPQFLPWLGYLELLSVSEVFVVLDDFELSNQSWSTRNRLFVSHGQTGWISLDLDRSQTSRSTFSEARESPERRWRRKLQRVVDICYRRAPQWGEVVDLLQAWLATEHQSVADLEVDLLRRIHRGLGLSTEIVRSSELPRPRGRRSVKLRSILNSVGCTTYMCAHGSTDYMIEDGGWESIEVLVQNHEPLHYDQFCSPQFVPRLAFVDALANVGWDGMRTLLPGTKHWKRLDEIAERATQWRER